VTFSEGPAGVSFSVVGAAALVVGVAEFGVVVGATAGAWTRGALDVFGADGAVVVGRTAVDGAVVAGVGDGAVAVGVAESVVCVAISGLCACPGTSSTIATGIASTTMLTTQAAARPIGVSNQGGVGGSGLSSAFSVDSSSGVVGSLISGSYGALRLLAFRKAKVAMKRMGYPVTVR
jgi:hypothetical protein